MRAAKARSAEIGESLKALLTRAVAAELDTHATRRAKGTRVRLPLFGDASGPRVRFSNAELEQALADADAASLSAGKPLRPRRRPARSR